MASMHDAFAFVAKAIGMVLLITIAIILSPVLLLGIIGNEIASFWYVWRLRTAWPSGKFVLLAYTNSALWAPYIETAVVPVIQSAAIVINRSEPDWKNRFPLEARALAFWGRHWEYNPLAVVLHRGMRVKVFRFYKAFEQYKHGNSKPLEEKVDQFLGVVRTLSESAT